MIADRLSERPTATDLLLAVDVGGTSVKGALLTGDGALLTASRVRTAQDHRAPLDSVHLAIDTLLAEAPSPPAALGLCTPGLVDPERGVVRYAANLGWSDLSLADLLRDRYRIPVWIDHDARAAAAAELAARGGSEVRDLLFVPLGTGVSGALVAGGAVVLGAGGAAGELGHVSIYPDGERCECGQRGCIEVYASAAGILRRYRKAGGRVDSLAEAIARLETDDAIRTVWADAIDALARGLVAMTAVLDPQLIVLGGGLSLSGTALLEPLRERLTELLTWRRPPELALSALGATGGIVGAALLAAGSLPPSAVRRLHTDLEARDAPDTGSSP
jgi:glucokinase